MSPAVILQRETVRVTELRRKPFQIILDGNAAGSIDRNQTLELPVEPGAHTLQARAGRYSSRTWTFDAVVGTVIRFRCNGAILWRRYVAALVVPTIVLKLDPA
jgi:hypothetical protein